MRHNHTKLTIDKRMKLFLLVFCKSCFAEVQGLNNERFASTCFMTNLFPHVLYSLNRFRWIFLQVPEDILEVVYDLMNSLSLLQHRAYISGSSIAIIKFIPLNKRDFLSLTLYSHEKNILCQTI